MLHSDSGDCGCGCIPVAGLNTTFVLSPLTHSWPFTGDLKK